MFETIEKMNIVIFIVCERAEIGKLTGLKILRSLTPCGFKSHRAHHFKKLLININFYNVVK